MAIFNRHIKILTTTETDTTYTDTIKKIDWSEAQLKAYPDIKNDSVYYEILTGRGGTSVEQIIQPNWKICTNNQPHQFFQTLTTSLTDTSWKWSNAENNYIELKKSSNTGTSTTIATIAAKTIFFNNLQLSQNEDATQFNVKSPRNTDTINFETNATFSGSIHATYFVATSDKHLKTNIQPWSKNALNIIKSTPIYIFNYINKPSDEVNIGVMAQDVIENHGEEFICESVCDTYTNEYDESVPVLNIKESKLVYVLWKAIQEQQEQIELLQREINLLKVK